MTPEQMMKEGARLLEVGAALVDAGEILQSAGVTEVDPNIGMSWNDPDED